ncbi:MAG: NAD-dependent formate dehydrogenase alpha subunit [uncultured Caballeronia sp.]|nr:MAG: NAD-dependent formate dehydrogenase alpha subunit [uncultured Caballeronia sp.]
MREGAKLIVIDPRRIDIVDTPHVKALYHLPLRLGTNVAMLNSLAHVIVTEGLLNEAFVAERCETRAFDQWREFVAREENSPEAIEAVTGVPAQQVREAACVYATGGNGAIYYGLGVTEHAQGSTAVMAIANLAMATANIGREGVGVNPLRGHNNVQGSCDMGSFPHELPGYRHIGDAAVRSLFEEAWDVKLQEEPGLRIPNMFDAATHGTFMGLYCQGEDIVQSDPNTQHVADALSSMECIVVQDIFLNETAKYAHVLLPGLTFLEKDGTFTNVERRISRVRKVMPPLGGYSDWEVTIKLSRVLGYEMNYSHPSEIMDKIARLTPTFHGVSYDRIDELGSIQWPFNEKAPDGTPTMHVDEFVRGKGRFVITKFVATPEKVTRKYPLLLTTGRILSQYNVGAQTRRRTGRRTENSRWHEEDRLEIHPVDAEDRGIKEDDWVGIESRANVITTDSSDWATNCPEYKVTAVQVLPVEQPSQWQQDYSRFNTQQLELMNMRDVTLTTSGK